MKQLIRFSIILISFGIFYLIGVACSYSLGTETMRYQLFSSGLGHASKLKPFFFTNRFLNESENENLYSAGTKENLSEWRTMLDNQFSITAIKKFIYENSWANNEEVKAVKGNWLKLEGSNLYKKDLIWKYLIDHKKTDEIGYIILAQQMEEALMVYNGNGNENGNDDEKKYNSAGVVVLTGIADLRAGKINSPLLKIRYAYQSMVGNRYLGNFDKVIAVSEAFVDNSSTKTIIKSWAWIHKAFALFQLERKVEANLFLVKSFDGGDQKKIRAYIGYDKSLTNETLNKCSTPDEKLATLVVDALHNPGPALSNIENIYSINPSSTYLDLLVSREINKLEDWVLGPKYLAFNSTSRENSKYDEASGEFVKQTFEDIKYMESFSLFLSKVESDNKSCHPELFQLAHAYLAYMQGDYDKAFTHINGINMNEKHDALFEKQVHITKLLIMVNKEPSISNEDLLTELLWFKNNSGSSKHSTPWNTDEYDEYGKPMSDWSKLMLTLAWNRENKGNISEAALLISLSDEFYHGHKREYLVEYYNDYFYYLDEIGKTKDVESILQLIDKKNKSDWEQFLLTNVKTDINRLKDLEGTMYIRNNDLENANLVWETIPTSYWHSKTFEYDTFLDANPFYVNFYSEHEHTVYDTIKYTKAEFVKKMLELKELADKGKNSAMNYFLLANGYYSTTYYGNSWMINRYWATVSWAYDWSGSPLRDDADNYYGCKLAGEYYEKAAKATKDKMFAALCYRMKGKCEDRRKFLELVQNKNKSGKFEDVTFPDYKENKYYQKLKKEYPEFYDRLIDDCTSFDDFLKHG